MTYDVINEARDALGRLDAEVERVRGDPAAVRVRCDPRDYRAAKARLMREGFSPQPRYGTDGHVFKRSGGSRGPPRDGHGFTDMLTGGRGR